MLAVLIWSGNFVVARGLSEAVSPVKLALLRWGVASVAAIPLAAPAVWRQRALVWRHGKYLGVVALLGVSMFNTFIYIAGRTTSALNLSLIAVASPVFVLLFAWKLAGEALPIRKVLGTVTAMLGVMLLITQGHLSTLAAVDVTYGDLWMLGASITFAIYTVLVRRKPPNMDQRTFLGMTFWLGTLILLPAALNDPWGQGPTLWSQDLVLAVLYIGLGASLAAYFLWNYAIARVGAGQVALIYYLIPLFSGLEAYLWLGESASKHTLISGILIVSGLTYASRTPPRAAGSIALRN